MERALKTTFAVIILVLSLFAPLVAGPLEDADAAVARGDYTSAMRLLRPLADQGNARAQSFLGFMYEYGVGVPQNYAEAVTWYRQAADQGYATAQTNLGGMYDRGQGVPQDYAEAAKWYRLAADQGDAPGQASLGKLYLYGSGVPKDSVAAMKLFQKAADQGDSMGQYHLGGMYESGREGVPQDYTEAAKWWRKAADQGYPNGQYSLGLMYKDGKGVPKDYVRAYMWLNLSTASMPVGPFGSEFAAKQRDEVASKMTPAQIAEAQKLTREWKPVSGFGKFLQSVKP